MTRLLIGWNVFAALLSPSGLSPWYSSSGAAHIRRNAALQDDGRFLILLVTALGAFASIARHRVRTRRLQSAVAPGLMLATVTIALSWAAGAHRLRAALRA